MGRILEGFVEIQEEKERFVDICGEICGDTGRYTGRYIERYVGRFVGIQEYI